MIRCKRPCDDVVINHSPHTARLPKLGGPFLLDGGKFRIRDRPNSALDQLQISDTAQQDSILVETYVCKERLYFRYEKGDSKVIEVRTVYGKWQENTLEDGTQYSYWTDPKSAMLFLLIELRA